MHLASVGFWFNSDDFFLLRAVREGGPFGLWSDARWKFFRPLASLSLWLDWQLFGTNAAGYHAVNVGLAMVASALVVAVARRLFPAAPAWLGAAAGVVFALMPSHVEAVAWVSCRCDLLATAFGLAAVAVGLRGGARAAVGAALLAALSCGAKESALGVPVFLGLIAYASGDRTRWTPALASFGAVVAMVALRGLALGRLVGGYGVAISPRGMASRVVPFALKAVAPTSPQEARVPLSDPASEAALALVACGIVALLAHRRGEATTERRVAWASALGFGALALPALTLGVTFYTWESGRFLYLPSSALAILGALALTRLSRPRAFVAATVVGAAYLAGDFQALRSWGVAGAQARSAMGALLALRGPVLLVSVPDVYRGAYVLRNGVADGLEFLRPGRHPDVLVLTCFSTERPGESPQVAPGRVAFPGPMPVRLVDDSSAEQRQTPERMRAFGAEGYRVEPFAIDLGRPGPVARGVLTARGFVRVP